jgi:outer membrane protein assembly factor BamB
MQLITRRLSRKLLVFLVIAVIFTMTFGAGAALADDTWTQTSRAEFESGTLFRVDTSSSPGDVKLAASGGSNYAYALRGKNTKTFWRYDASADSWTPLANTPANVKYGGSLAYDGGNYIYAFRGDSTTFWRYDISANSWTTRANAPGTVKEGGALIYNNGYVYALQGNNTKNFWRYNVSTNSWTPMASTHDNVKEGGALTTDGGNYIYAFQCVGTSIFWRYSISANSWTLLAATPGDVGYGAALTYSSGGYIYALRGKYTQDFWRYDISANSWTSKAATLGDVQWGGALAFSGGNYIYALRGKYTWDFWRYDVSANSWTARTHAPSTVSYGGALAVGGVSYYGSGNLTSSAHDTGYTADFGTISWTGTTPAGTALKFRIATNTDNATWNFLGPDGTSGTYYTTGSGQAIWSGHDGDRYIKYRAFLDTTDTARTPVLNDVSITCVMQVDMPAVSTAAATLVEETTATLHGTVTDDGGGACQYRFEYDTDSGEPYTYSTPWTGNKTTGQSFDEGISGLGKGTKYYFRAQVKNGAGTSSGSELNFLTKPDEPVVSTFTATVVSDTRIDLTWTKGEGAWKTLIRRDTDDYPADRNDGVQAYFDTGTSCSDTGLTPGTTYYYRAWSYVTGSEQWSDWYQDASATTTGEPEVPPLSVGGTILKVNKAQVLAPWLMLFAVVSLVTGGVAVGLKKRLKG